MKLKLKIAKLDDVAEAYRGLYEARDGAFVLKDEFEIADPVDGSDFNEEDRNVLTYIATAFAKYLNGRGVVLDESDEEVDNVVAW